MRSLAADGPRRSQLGLLLVAVLLAAWATWFLCAKVTLYEVAESARLEVDRAAHAIEALVDGRVVATQLVLGRDVAVDAVLVELDVSEERSKLDEEKSRWRGLSAELEALNKVIAAEDEVDRRDAVATSAGQDEARAREREADGLARFAEEEVKRLALLQGEGNVAELELLRAKAEADRLRSAADALRFNVVRLDYDQQTRRSQREARVAELRRDVAHLEGAIETSCASMELIGRQIEQRTIRAPVAGRVGEVSDFGIGSVVLQGQKLGAVVPAGKLIVVAECAPTSAVGRIKPGQRARVRLDAFPWTQYGSLDAIVTSVASELRDGKIRVELALHQGRDSLVAVEHGLTGSVEVEVDRVSPAALVMRSVGELLRRQSHRTVAAGR